MNLNQFLGISIIDSITKIILAFLVFNLYGCFSDPTEWEANVGPAGFPTKANMITDETDNSYAISQLAFTKVNANGEIPWSIDFSVVDQGNALFANYIEKNESELTVFLSSETILYQLTIDELGNILDTQTYEAPTDINLIEVNIVKHNDQSYGVLTQTIGVPDHNYLKLDDTGLTLLAHFEQEDVNIEPTIFDYGRKIFISNGEIDCASSGVSSFSFGLAIEPTNWIKCFDSSTGESVYDTQSSTEPAASFIAGNLLAFAGTNQLEIHDLSSQELLHTLPTGGYTKMLAASEQGIVVYTAATFPQELTDESTIEMISWQGELIWSRPATSTFPLYGTFSAGKLFITQFNAGDENASDEEFIFPPEQFETVQINASGNKINTYNHEGDLKPVLETPGKVTKHPAITTTTTDGKPRMLSFYYAITGDPLFEIETSLILVQQF